MQIDAATLASLGDLEMTGRAIATGYLYGRHAGQRHGAGVEFAQYRNWQPGDPRHSIDWRLYARSGQYHVREAELETDLRVWLVLDTSASMAVRSPAGALTKLEFALRLAAALGYVAQQQGDEIGLVELGRRPRVRLPAAAGRDQWYRLLGCLDELHAEGQIRDTETLPLLDASEGALIFLLSDFYQQADEISELVDRLAMGNRDLRALCLECEAERELDFAGTVRLRDPETGAVAVTSAPTVKAKYRAAREDYLTHVAQRVGSAGGRFTRFNVDRPMDPALRDFLACRDRIFK